MDKGDTDHIREATGPNISPGGLRTASYSPSTRINPARRSPAQCPCLVQALAVVVVVLRPAAPAHSSAAAQSVSAFPSAVTKHRPCPLAERIHRSRHFPSCSPGALRPTAAGQLACRRLAAALAPLAVPARPRRCPRPALALRSPPS